MLKDKPGTYGYALDGIRGYCELLKSNVFKSGRLYVYNYSIKVSISLEAQQIPITAWRGFVIFLYFKSEFRALQIHRVL